MQRPKGSFSGILLWAFFLLFGSHLQAQSSREVAVELSAVKTANNHTELRWKSDTGVIRYFVYKRLHVDSNWVLLDSMGSSLILPMHPRCTMLIRSHNLGSHANTASPRRKTTTPFWAMVTSKQASISPPRLIKESFFSS